MFRQLYYDNKPVDMSQEFINSLIGSYVPDLELKAYHNKGIETLNLRSYKGQWLVLFFYPADFTFVCPTELEELAHKYEVFKSLNTEVISVSTDTVYTHKAWHDASPGIAKITFPMGADTSGALSRALQAYVSNDGMALRATAIIDPDGIIRVYEVNDMSIGRSIDELLRKLHAAQFIREHGDQVCPANWTPGGKTLRPGLDLVGKL